ncbi:MAG: hypothetical protein ACRC0G_07260 [Fusobacteriaceae bacterium]
MTPDKFELGYYTVEVNPIGRYRLEISPYVIVRDLRNVLDAQSDPESESEDVLCRVKHVMAKDILNGSTIGKRSYYKYLTLMKALLVADIDNKDICDHTAMQVVALVIIDSILCYMRLIILNDDNYIESIKHRITVNAENIDIIHKNANFDRALIGSDYNIKNLYNLVLKMNNEITEIDLFNELTDAISNFIHQGKDTNE